MQPIPLPPNINQRMRKFRFIVTNSGQDGCSQNIREQPQVAMAPSPQYLINLYAQCGDKIQILEELPPDEETRNYGKMNISDAIRGSQTQGWAAKGSLGSGHMMNLNASEAEIQALQKMHGEKVSSGQTPPPPQGTAAPPQVQPQVQQAAPSAPPPAPAQPTYFKIGSIECKMENGKVYQKQWMRVTETEMSNYRLISDKNNKILPMDGKHLEVLKWAISEDESNSQA